MRSRSHGSTTHPETITGSESGARAAVAIRWVFPEARTTLVADGATFGRDADCTIVLPGHDVSRRHAEARRAGLLPIVKTWGAATAPG